jgi:hypothetical protein
MTERYIVFWKTTHGQQVTTVVDAHNQPVLRDRDYLEKNGIEKLVAAEEVFAVLSDANGEKVAARPELVRATLGWDV